MTKNIKVFAGSILISAIFFFGMNFGTKVLTDMLSPQLFVAQVLQTPLLRHDVKGFTTNARSALSVFVDEQGKSEVLFEKNANDSLPIASITKLMTALIVMEQYDLDENANDLLHSMLIESNNDSAKALSSMAGESNFLLLMNEKAKNIGLEKTFFVDAAGVNSKNVSTAHDLFLLSKYIMEQNPRVFDILSLPRYTLHGESRRAIKNTNEFLGGPLKIIGGKTGFTLEARECLVLLIQSPKDNGYLVNVVLGSENRFEDMNMIIDWASSII